jgi:hypothetical protein
MLPRTPLAFMSRTRSCTSYVPRRTCSKVSGSAPQSSLGRPATAFEAECPDLLALDQPGVHQQSRGHGWEWLEPIVKNILMLYTPPA